jgi:Antibiotic biosynthesis monooxygenase
MPIFGAPFCSDAPDAVDLTAQREVSAPPGCAQRENGGMILEHAGLGVRSGEEQSFERAFAEAKSIIASMPGFRKLSLDRCIEQPTRYLLLV